MKIVTFYSDKGGVGTTMLNVCIASHLAYVLNKKVCIIDTAGGFRGLSSDREKEVAEMRDRIDPHNLTDVLQPAEYDNLLKNPLEGSRVKIFRIIDFQELLTFIKKYKNIFDYVFIDVSGVSFENFQFIMKSHHIMLISTQEDMERDFNSYAAFQTVLSNKQEFNNENLVMVLNNTHFESPTFKEYTLRMNPLEIPENPKAMLFFDKILYHRSFYKDYSSIIGLNGVSDEFDEFCEALCQTYFGEQKTASA